MDLLMNNPLADMYGPLFLLVYAATIALVAVGCRVLTRQLDWTASMGPPPVPSNPDPHEIAYLRGGENEVARSVVFALVQKELLSLTKFGKSYQVGRTKEKPDSRRLSPVEQTALAWFTNPRDTSEMFKADGLTARLRPFCAAYEQRLKGEHLLLTDDARQTALLVLLAGMLLVVGLGAYKLVVAVAEGRFNVGFLIILGVVGVVVLFKFCRAPRVSSRGRAYLERLRVAFDRLQYQTYPSPKQDKQKDLHDDDAAAVYGGVDPALLMVGVFGVAALAGTPYATFGQSFQRASVSGDGGASGGSSCGSSCGSSSDSSSGGSSCGSSCGGGGCGGGGCGG